MTSRERTDDAEPADPLRDAEERRIRAEIRKLDAEAAKLEIETLEKSKQSELPWYRKAKTFQILGIAIVSAPLVFFYLKDFALPIIRAENIDLSLKLEQRKEELEKRIGEFEQKELELVSDLAKVAAKRDSLAQEREKMIAERDLLLGGRADLEKEKEYLETKLKTLAEQYAALARDANLTESDQVDYAGRAAALESDIEKLRTDNKQFRLDYQKLVLDKDVLERRVTELLAKRDVPDESIYYALDQDLLRDAVKNENVFQRAVPHSWTRSPRLGAYYGHPRENARLKVLINETGDVVATSAVEDAGQLGTITEAAIEDFVKGVKYRPATFRGRRIKVWAYYYFEPFDELGEWR